MLPAGGRREASRAQALAFSQYFSADNRLDVCRAITRRPAFAQAPSAAPKGRGIQIPKSALEIQTGMALHAQIPNSNYRGKQPPNLDFSLDGIVHDDAAAGAPLYPSRDRPNCFPILRA
jgi:hypothetical protein